MRASHVVLVLLVCSGSACVTATLDVGTNQSSCQATCGTPPGTHQVATSLSEAYSQVSGRWLFCTGSNLLFAPSDAIGVEFGPGNQDPNTCGSSQTNGNCGDGYYLVQGASGPVRGKGFAYEWTYDLTTDISTADGHLAIDLHPEPNATSTSPFWFYPCPKELRLTPVMQSSSATLVWLDAASDGDAGSGSDGGDTGDATNGGTCPPAGLVETFDTLAHASAAITGRWQVCTGEQNLAQFAPADSVGLEFGPASSGGGVCPQWSPTAPCLGGALYFLVAGPTGLTRGAGRMYQYEYGLMGDPTSDPQLEFVSAWGGSWGTTFRYSPAPRELDVASFGYQGGATMVSIP